MVQEHSSKAYNNCAPDPHDTKITYKAMAADRFSAPFHQAASSSGKSGQEGGTKNKKSKTDVWGPIYQNREHFINMHNC